MSRVPYTVNIDEFICSALTEIREMDKVRDYSRLMAVVERIQSHANKMEEAIWARKSTIEEARKILDDENLSANQKIKKIRKVYDKNE